VESDGYGAESQDISCAEGVLLSNGLVIHQQFACQARDGDRGVLHFDERVLVLDRFPFDTDVCIQGAPEDSGTIGQRDELGGSLPEHKQVRDFVLFHASGHQVGSSGSVLTEP
jgi:hypothetical protein